MISEVMTLLVRYFVREVAGVLRSMASSGWYNRAMPSDSNTDPADVSTASAVPGPLADLKVVDLSRVLAGPYLTMMLGDMGAEVVKIEQPGSGDDTRRWGPPFLEGESTYYLAVNRNKRSVTLNLKHPRCRELLLQMAADADILVENFKTGTMERMGLGYEDVLRPLNPRLVYVSVTGYGRTGPYAERPGYDYMGQAMGGIMSVTGEPDGEPMKYGVAIADLTTAMTGCSAVLAAIHHRDRTGLGQRVDLSLLETVVGWLIHLATDYFATGQLPPRIGNGHSSIVPYQTFKASDRYFAFGALNDRQFRDFSRVLGHDEWPEDPRFRSNVDRVAHRAELQPLVEAVLHTRTASEWVDALLAVGVPAGPVNSIAEVFADPQVLARNMRIEVPHPKLGPIGMSGISYKHGDTPGSVRRHPPMLGEHTDEVLGELGVAEDEIGALRREGAI
jgi:crotonobetainyl-CoA:carnitine CoA-transferase CaiB-like acyl-CoA transferase